MMAAAACEDAIVAGAMRPPFLQTLGLLPLRQRLHETRLALAGDAHTPPSRFDLSSLDILEPRLSAALWRGKRPYGRQVPLYNLFNRTPTPVSEGWSVRKRQVRDYRGGRLTYDSHNGTDFATPPGTVLVAPAPARVTHIVSEFHRGGLKLVLDHGDGLITTMAHLADTLVSVGARVARGAPVALSGASGLNFVAALLADPPHLHFNVWLNGIPIDPYAIDGEVSMWRSHNDPAPHRGAADPHPAPSDFDEDAIDAMLEACPDQALVAALRDLDDAQVRANQTLFAANYFPTRFPHRPLPYRAPAARAPRLDLPFLPDDYDGAVIPPGR